jgi:hypothetical protein
MKLPILLFLVLGCALQCSAQLDQAKRRAKDVVNQNNVRQGVPPPSQRPAKTAAPVAATRAAVISTNVSSPAALQSRNIGNIQKALAAIKTGTPATDAQKQQIVTALTSAVRGTKPAQATLKTFADALAPALTEAAPSTEHLSRLAQNIEAALNAKPFASAQYDAVVTDVQATLEVAGAKTKAAESAAKSLKAVGDETRK